MKQRRFRTTVFLAGLLGIIAAAARPEPQSRTTPRAETSQAAAGIQYNRDIRPILSNHCFKCHGPDERARKAGMRLDIREHATQPNALGGTAIVPGEPQRSALLQRVFATDPATIMPPPHENRQLNSRQKQLLKNWIELGAPYQPHWSFIPIERPTLPKVSATHWTRNPIDYFVLERLDNESLRPGTEADKTTLIRRLTFDLTGLPPTPAEIDRFLADNRDNAYESLVDRLLDSPRFGERMAVEWLDAARFADTHGYHIDSGRDMTRWRDWVIHAFNRNLPFDQFTIDQLAGDLRPEATIEQRIASGFNRNHMINFEGGAIPEEYHNAYIVDRVNTTGTVWLGLTIGCAQCHDHKFDPVSQTEYYQLYAFFHNVPENGLDGRAGNAPPLVKFPTADQQQQIDALNASIKDIDRQLAGPIADVDADQADWEQRLRRDSTIAWQPIVIQHMAARSGATLRLLDDKSIVVSGENPATDSFALTIAADLATLRAIRLEALPDDSLSAKGPGRSVNGNIVLTDFRVSRGAVPASGPQDAGAIAAADRIHLKTASADFSQSDYPVSRAIDDQPQSGWAIYPEVGKPHAAVFELADPPHAARAEPAKTDAAPLTVTVTLEFHSKFAQHSLGRFRLSASDAEYPHPAPAAPDRIRELIAIEPGDRSDEQRAELRKHFRNQVSARTKQMADELAQRRKELSELERRVPTSMVMQELDQPRDTFLLLRGQYDKKGDRVAPGVPAALPPLPSGAAANRLSLAEWLVRPDQPLTARVIVNRYWQMYFGTGIVKTSEDFGSQGEWPSHPELLDWLAAEFRDCGWDVKHMQRLIVNSATYRQSSRASRALYERDPENRLLARGPRMRLQVEFIRDQALAVAGLLDREIGGRSVAPYQPAGIWEELASRQDGKNWTAQEYVQGHGADLYRRTMYTFIKRTAPPPSLVTFDAPDRETCTVRRARTNTPLQALVLMNDPTYVEAARKLAERLMTEPPPSASIADRITLAFRLATARRPGSVELELLQSQFSAQLAVYRGDEAAALKLLAVGESPRDPSLGIAELAAWTVVANTILNLDETLTKG